MKSIMKDMNYEAIGKVHSRLRYKNTCPGNKRAEKRQGNV
jgi:hypothetical protein